MTTVPVRRPGLEVEVLDGEAVVLDRNAARLHHLNATATSVWELCDGRHAIDSIAAALAHVSGHDLESVRTDVTRILEELSAEELVVKRAAAGGSTG